MESAKRIVIGASIFVKHCQMLHMCVHHEKELTRGGTRRGTCALGFFFWTRLCCRLDVGSVSFPLIWDHSERRACSRNSWSKLPCPGGHRADLAACPLHGDSSGFNYPQLRFIFFQLGYALCPSILCESLSHRYQGELQRRVCARERTHDHRHVHARHTQRPHKGTVYASIWIQTSLSTSEPAPESYCGANALPPIIHYCSVPLIVWILSRVFHHSVLCWLTV